jgi:hypothetical protein
VVRAEAGRGAALPRLVQTAGCRGGRHAYREPFDERLARADAVVGVVRVTSHACRILTADAPCAPSYPSPQVHR